MKTLAILLITALGLAAQAPASTGSTTKKATTKATPKTTAKKATAAPPQAMTIPKGAIANPDGTYAWTDKDGTKWTYAKTPFGVMKSRTSDAPATTPTLQSNVKVFDEGDKVRFERTTPFGVMKTEKSKSDLTDDERKLVESQTTTPAGKQD